MNVFYFSSGRPFGLDEKDEDILFNGGRGRIGATVDNNFGLTELHNGVLETLPSSFVMVRPEVRLPRDGLVFEFTELAVEWELHRRRFQYGPIGAMGPRGPRPDVLYPVERVILLLPIFQVASFDRANLVRPLAPMHGPGPTLSGKEELRQVEETLREALIFTYFKHADLEEERGRSESAQTLYQETFKLVERTAQRSYGQRIGHEFEVISEKVEGDPLSEVWQCWFDVGMLLTKMGKTDEAASWYQQQFDQLERIVKEKARQRDPDDQKWILNQLISAQVALGDLKKADGLFAAAESCYQKAIASVPAREVVDPKDARFELPTYLALAYVGLSELARTQEDVEKEKRSQQKAADILGAAIPLEAGSVRWSLNRERARRMYVDDLTNNCQWIHEGTLINHWWIHEIQRMLGTVLFGT